MRNLLCFLTALCAVCISVPGYGYIPTELTYREKLARAELVIIGTVTANDGAGTLEATSNVTVLTTLKGGPQTEIVVGTSHPVVELNTQCCRVGATYLMFLARPPGGGRLQSVNGRFGMIQIGR